MAEGLLIGLEHTGLTSEPIYLSDVEDGVDFLNSFRKPGPVYIPTSGEVLLVYTKSVAISYESGAIRSFIESGHLASRFMIGDSATASFWPPSTTSRDLYIDGVNGSDDNDGFSSSTPVKTWDKIVALAAQPINDETLTIHFSGGVFDCDINDVIDLNSFHTEGNGRLVLKGSSSLVTTGSITDNNPQGDSWHLEDNTQAFTAADVGRIMKMTSGFDSGYYFMIVEVISPTVVRVHCPEYTTPFIFPGDTYELYEIGMRIQGTVLAGSLQRGADRTGSELAPLRLSIEDMEIQGGVRLSGCSIDLKRVLLREGVDDGFGNSWAMWLHLSDVMMDGSSAVPEGVLPATATGVQLFFCRLRDRDLDNNYRPSCFSGYDWTSNGVYLWNCNGSCLAVASARCDELSMKHCENLIVFFLSGEEVEVDIHESRSLLEMNRIYLLDAYLNVRNSVLTISVNGNYLSGVIDGDNNQTNGIHLWRQSVVNLLVGGGGAAFDVSKATADGILIEEGSSFLTTGAVSSDNNGGNGITIKDAQIYTETGTVGLNANGADGLRAYGASGYVKVNSTNNTGWGLQSLEGSILRNNASAFAGNGSGATNVDGDSKWI